MTTIIRTFRIDRLSHVNSTEHFGIAAKDAVRESDEFDGADCDLGGETWEYDRRTFTNTIGFGFWTPSGRYGYAYATFEADGEEVETRLGSGEKIQLADSYTVTVCAALDEDDDDDDDDE